MNTSVKVGRIRLKNPVIAASGTFGVEYNELVDIESLGAVVAKTITLNAREGNPPPRLVETPAGMLNSIGLENAGLQDFINKKLPAYLKLKVPVIASISAETAGELMELAKRLDKTAVEGIELNLSCPNIRSGTLISQDPKATYEAVRQVKKATEKTVIAKLSPNVTDIRVFAKAAEEGGADAVSLINTFFAMAVDIEKRRPLLGNITGGLSGPPIKPIALKMVWDAFNEVDIPIIGIGGIMTYKDAMEFIICGATAIQVGTANFINPQVTVEIIDGIRQYMTRKNINSLKKLIGSLEVR
ncbi:MAG: dihydroorotate dehydrogenase [Candidatus Omnitrophica bacterium]|nr:dihydroorotate dehydrogenase [Candidatus Omnitrophota bacterium]